MTDKEKKELKDGVISIFKNFNILDHIATIGGLRNNILGYIDSMQEEPVSEDLEKAANEWNAKALDTPFYMALDDNGNPYEVRQDYTTHAESFKAGAKWGKNQAMAEIQSQSMALAHGCPEENASNELKAAADNALESIIDKYDIISVGSCLEMFKLGAKWQKTQEYTCYEEAFEDGAKWKVENLWKPADGDDLPKIDREVVVLTQPYPLENLEYAVSFAHRPNPNGWDGKSVTTDKIEHYTPKIYDKGGWNIPDVKFWLDVEFPKRNRTMSKYTEGEFDSIVCPHWFRAGGIEGCTAGMPPSCSECNHPDKRIEKVKWSSISTED